MRLKRVFGTLDGQAVKAFCEAHGAARRRQGINAARSEGNQGGFGDGADVVTASLTNAAGTILKRRERPYCEPIRETAGPYWCFLRMARALQIGFSKERRKTLVKFAKTGLSQEKLRSSMSQGGLGCSSWAASQTGAQELENKSHCQQAL